MGGGKKKTKKKKHTLFRQVLEYPQNTLLGVCFEAMEEEIRTRVGKGKNRNSYLYKSEEVEVS